LQPPPPFRILWLSGAEPLQPLGQQANCSSVVRTLLATDMLGDLHGFAALMTPADLQAWTSELLDSDVLSSDDRAPCTSHPTATACMVRCGAATPLQDTW
jgi:hypothetical protein